MTLNIEEIRRVYDHDRHGREVGRLVLDTVEALCDEVERLRAAITPTEVPEGFTEVAFLPKPKYVVIEEDDGWHAYSHDDHGAFS